MRKIVIAFFVTGILLSCKDKKEEPLKDEPMVKTATTDNPPSEFADAKYMDWGKKSQQQFESGDIDAWASQFADNAVYQWSNGDSLAGKQAIVDYWKDRRKNVIQNIKFTNDIWLPIKVNKPQRGPDMQGNWLLSWYQVNATYKSGKSLSFWVHSDLHYNDKDEVDRVIQYIDMAPIKAAISSK